MEKKKHIGETLFIIICVVIVCVCLAIWVGICRENKKLEKENEKLETLVVKTESGVDIETDYIHVGDNKFYVKVPIDFRQLDYEEIITKYNGDIPDVVFSNDDATINIAISLTDNKMTNNQINHYKKYMKEFLLESVEIIDDNYYEVDDHNVGQIKLVSEAVDTSIYNNMIFFSYDNKLVIVAFNCTADLRGEWQNVGDFIIDSLFFM